MIDKSIINFLKELKRHNDREWFMKNKPGYEAAKKEFEHFVNRLIQGITRFDKDIAMVNAKDSVFRIFRDIRFSKDKSPYKENFGAYVVKGGRRSGYAGYYLHIEPGNSFLAGGVYMPPSPVLKSIRQEIFDHIDEFNDIIQNKKFKTHFTELMGEKLVSSPRGFPPGFEYIELLKHKHYSVWKQIQNEVLRKAEFLEYLLEMYAIMKPFNDFLNRAIDFSRESDY